MLRPARSLSPAAQVEPAAFLAAPFAALTDLIAACDKPVIAAINGICMGGGLELALACDIRVAAHDVTHIGLPETRLDIFPGGGGMQRLARAIGTGRTMDMVLRGRTVNAARAYAMGIIHDLADDALAFSLEIAQDLASRDPAALTAAKQLVRTALAKPGAQGLADERLAFAELIRDNQPSLDRLRHVINAGTAVEAL
jgi:enoyl-CoA hydratase